MDFAPFLFFFLPSQFARYFTKSAAKLHPGSLLLKEQMMRLLEVMILITSQGSLFTSDFLLARSPFARPRRFVFLRNPPKEGKSKAKCNHFSHISSIVHKCRNKSRSFSSPLYMNMQTSQLKTSKDKHNHKNVNIRPNPIRPA